MQLSMKCSVAVHCLIFIHEYSSQIRVTSSLLAQSTGCHPVVIRGILSGLKKAGILSVARGTGGASLRKDPEEVTLLDIYFALEPEGLGELIGVHPCGERPCPVAQNIAGVLQGPYHRIEEAIRTAMESVTLASMIEDYEKRVGEQPALFETERLKVRVLSLTDVPALFQILSDGEVMRYLEPPFTLEQTVAFVQKYGLCAPPQVYGVVEKESGRLIGHLIFHPDEPKDGYELGWVLQASAWGKGYATELTEGAALYGEKQGVRQLMIECLPEQKATGAVARKTGFLFKGEKDGLLRYLRAL